MRLLLAISATTILLLIFAPARAEDFQREPLDPTGFVSIFDGRTLSGWHVSAQTGHSGKSKHKSGGRWVVEDGAITGSQDVPGNGGIILTDKPYGNFEVVLEMNNDFGPDSGLFLRSTEKGQAYQYMVDYHATGNLAGIYGEGLSGGISLRNFDFLDKPSEIKKDACPFPLPIKTSDWPKLWQHGQWNELRRASRVTRRRSLPGSTASASWNSRTTRSATPTPAASPCKSTAAATSPSSSSATARSA